MSEWRCGYCLRTAGHCRRRGISPVCDGCRERLRAAGKKFCRECGEARPVEEFDRVGLGENRRAVCKACRQPTLRERRTAYMQRWRAKNPDYRRVYAKAYIAANPERVARHRRTAYVNSKIRQSERLRAARSGER